MSDLGNIIGFIIIAGFIVLCVGAFLGIMLLSKYNGPIFKTTVTITPNDEVDFDALRKAGGWDKDGDSDKPEVKETKAEVVDITEKDGKIILTLKTDDNKS